MRIVLREKKMSLYGIPYMGSKTGIAEELISILPRGERFVDLFGGGFAMTHCALFSDKWGKFLYNELNPLLVDLICKGIHGFFDYDKFKPEFITREKFSELKEKGFKSRYCPVYLQMSQNHFFQCHFQKPFLNN